VVAELLKTYWHCGKQAPLYYYRDKDQKEIDVLIVQDRTVYPIEVKKTASPGRDSVRHFSLLESMGLSLGAGAVICLANECVPITAFADAISVWQIY